MLATLERKGYQNILFQRSTMVKDTARTFELITLHLRREFPSFFFLQFNGDTLYRVLIARYANATIFRLVKPVAIHATC